MFTFVFLKIASSRGINRGHYANKVFLHCGKPQNKKAVKRDIKKEEKIARFNLVSPSPPHALEPSFLMHQPVFFSGTSSTSLVPYNIHHGVMFSAIDDLKVVNTILGATTSVPSHLSH